MTKPINRDRKSLNGVTHNHNSNSPSKGTREVSEVHRDLQLPSPQRGREVSKLLLPTNRQGSSSCRVCGATFEGNIPLSGGVSARGAGVGYAFLGKPTPSAYGSHPSKGGDFQRRLSSISSRPGLRILQACLWVLVFAPSPAVLAQVKNADKPAESPASTKPRATGERQQHAQKVFAIKHADVDSIARTLSIFAVPVAIHIQPNRELRVIGISAPAALMPTIEETIRRLDVPPPTPQNVELTAYLLLGADHEGPVATELNDVVKQLRATFGFKGFRTLDTLVVRSRDGRGASVKGIAHLGSATAYSSPYHFRYNAARILPDEKGRSIRLDGLAFSASIVTGRDGAGVVTRSDDAGFGADVDIREGQKVVVGKTAVEGTNTALMLVITAKVLE